MTHGKKPSFKKTIILLDADPLMNHDKPVGVAFGIVSVDVSLILILSMLIPSTRAAIYENTGNSKLETI